MRNSIILIMLLSLAACVDPLANFERIEDVELAPDQEIAQALRDANDEAPTTGLFARILNREPAPADVVDTEAENLAALVAEETVDAGVLKDEQADVSDIDAPVVSGLEMPVVAEPAQATGLRGWLKRAVAAESDVATPAAQSEDIAAVDAPSDALVDPEKRRGLLPVDDAPKTLQTVSLDLDLSQSPDPTGLVDVKKRGGLLGTPEREQARTGPDARDVPYGTVLAFGEVARVCEAKTVGSLGRRLEKVPFHGRGYTLYDSAPDAITARTFYVTGFKDKCPRQFTAALALFGSALVHEQLRYGRPSDEYPYSTTDQAYETVKRSVCKVGKNKPCGIAIALMQNNTVFISSYEKFTDNARWADILLHDGAVVAAAIKTP